MFLIKNTNLILSILFSISMYYILNTRYHGGDLQVYVDEICQMKHLIFVEFPIFSSTQGQQFYLPHGIGLVQLLTKPYYILTGCSHNSAIILAGISSFIFLNVFLNIAKNIGLDINNKSNYNNTLVNKNYFYFAIIVITIPIANLNLTFIGKENIIFPLLAVLFYSIANNGRLFYQLCIVFLIGLIRPYQGVLLLGGLLFANLIVEKGLTFKKLFILLLIFVGIFVSYIVLGKYIKMILLVGGLEEYLVQTYKTEELKILEPLGYPLTFLQLFRPFPFEVRSFLDIFVSIQYCIELFGLFFILVKFKKIIKILDGLNIGNKKFIYFYIMYFICTLVIFSHSSNVGDLSRRRTYIMFLIPLLIYIYIQGKRRVGSYK